MGERGRYGGGRGAGEGDGGREGDGEGGKYHQHALVNAPSTPSATTTNAQNAQNTTTTTILQKQPNQLNLSLISQNKNSEYCAPLTSFDWSDHDPKRVATSSIDTTCTIWDIEVSEGSGFEGVGFMWCELSGS